MTADPDARSAEASEALLRPVRPGNAFEDTVERLLQTIRLGVLAPGESLPPERELAARLGVSRDTVREAIKSLADAGYLVSRRGRYGGTFLADELPATPSEPTGSTRADIDDALRLREILEVGAARMAATRTLTAAEREELWTRLTDVAAPRPTITAGWTPGCTWRSPKPPAGRRWCRWWRRTGCGSTACWTRSRCCRAISPTPTNSTRRS